MTPEEVLNYYFRAVQIIAWLEKDTRQLEADIMELSATVAEERQIGLEIVTSRKLVAASGGQPSCGLPKGIDVRMSSEANQPARGRTAQKGHCC